jgi:hypothetical protein
MLDYALGVRDGDVGSPLGRITATLPNMLERVRGNVAPAHGVFEHLPGVA